MKLKEFLFWVMFTQRSENSCPFTLSFYMDPLIPIHVTGNRGCEVFSHILSILHSSYHTLSSILCITFVFRFFFHLVTESVFFSTLSITHRFSNSYFRYGNEQKKQAIYHFFLLLRENSAKTNYIFLPFFSDAKEILKSG